MKSINSIVRLLTSFVVWIVLAILLVGFIAFYGVSLVGYTPYTVLSGSMEPAIPTGAMAYIQKVEPSTLKEGDVITFERGAVGETETYYDTFGDEIKLETGTSYIFTHRIVSVDKENESFVTKGDANAKEDPTPVSFQEVKGKVAYAVPTLGFVNVWLHTDTGRIAVIGFTAVFVLLLFLSSYTPKEKEEEKEETETDEQEEPVFVTTKNPYTDELITGVRCNSQGQKDDLDGKQADTESVIQTEGKEE